MSKEGSAAVRHVLVEAAWSAAKSPGPLPRAAAGRLVGAIATSAIAHEIRRRYGNSSRTYLREPVLATWDLDVARAAVSAGQAVVPG